MRKYIDPEEIAEEVLERLPELLRRMLNAGFSNCEIINTIYDVIAEHITLSDVDYITGEDIDALMAELGVQDYGRGYDVIMANIECRLTDRWYLRFTHDDEDDVIGIIILRKRKS